MNDKNDLKKRVNSLKLNLLDNIVRVFCSKKYDMIKIFKGSEHVIYCYTDNKAPKYSEKIEWAPKDISQIFSYDSDLIAGTIKELCHGTALIKWCMLDKKQTGIRMRFDLEEAMDYGVDREDLVETLKDSAEYLVKQTIENSSEELPDKKVKEKRNMKNDFSLGNLKDALVTKVTHLDRKTVTVLAIIALLLLIVGKYQTIKDIAIGIKDKVKRSKNFKAMVEDGTNALNALKKILGIKNNGGSANEA